MKYLLDTNVLDGIKHFTFERSRKKRISPNPGVVRFFLSASDDTLFVPSLVIGELFYGAENAWRRNDSKNAVEYEHFANMMLEHYEVRIVRLRCDQRGGVSQSPSEWEWWRSAHGGQADRSHRSRQ